MQDLADYCKITVEAIINYRKNKAIPFMAIAYRMANFFDLKVEELYQLEDYDLALGLRNASNKRGRKKEKYNLECTVCGGLGYAKGFCQKHYNQKRKTGLK
ncbi:MULTISPECIES: helix-turn-helix transcriptional regulator [unclassified Paenibacillus]|uniref:helix-turn-helix domain-containing protein n=1 Tax=unclassified Paenibacillus TaxID=185978 RepID=UPI0027883D64|nr:MULTISPECIES: helix-turn-helix transcriptional regulator [unclassified Paenibacillus]MDQ0896387.1 DNA-binding XRE family transcriptional regulator [Paenibacillus sp. V4I7]MDQ0914069.1 DNA-binding XRE family transcriptional regulator [Paenibacillus sp. V4I5]